MVVEPDDGGSWFDAPTCPGPRSLNQRRHDALRNGLRRYLTANIAGVRGKSPADPRHDQLGEPARRTGSLGPVSGTGTVLHGDKRLRLRDGRWLDHNGWTTGPS